MISACYVDPVVDCAFTIHEGEFEPGEGVEVLLRLAEDPLHKPGMKIYRDIVRCKFPDEYNYSYFKKNMHRQLTVTLPKALGSCKIGWLVNSARDYSVVHQIGISTRLTPSSIVRQPFREQQKLLAWLGLPKSYNVMIPERAILEAR